MVEQLLPDTTGVPVIRAGDSRPPAIDPGVVDSYITQRIEQYAGWYDKKSGPVKKRYLYIKAVTVIGGAVVPVLVNINTDLARVAATLVSLAVVILVSWDSVFQYGKQWKNYRSTEQFLRQETMYYKHHVGFYSDLEDAKAFRIYVQRCENAIAQENAVTLDTLTRESHGGKQGSGES